MEKRPETEPKKSNKKTIILLVAVILVIAGVILFELDQFGVLCYKPQYLDIRSDQLGSAQKLEGRTAMVTIFASDRSSRWDFTQEESITRRKDFFDFTKINADWFVEQGKKYGKELEFCFAQDENDELLYYEYDFGDIMLYDHFNDVIQKKVAYDEWDCIESIVDSDRITNELGCNNIVYYFYLNYHEENHQTGLMLTSATKQLERPYEIVWVPYQAGNVRRDPMIIAHETLHLFGAPDLYIGDMGSDSFKISKEFVEYVEEHYDTDIMFVTGGKKYRERVFDRVDAEVTDITAYYIGWLDKAPPEIDDFRMRRSQFDKKGQ